MTAETVKKARAAEETYAAQQVLEYGARLYAAPRLEAILEALLQVPSAGDVRAIDMGQTYDTPSRPRITLSLERQDSPFVRDVAKLLHVRFDKQPAGEALLCTAQVNEVTLQVTNYLPESCVVEYHDEYIPGHMGKVAKVVCNSPAKEVAGGDD